MPGKLCPYCGSRVDDGKHVMQKNAAGVPIDSAAYDVHGGLALDFLPRARVQLDRAKMSATCTFSTTAIDRVGDKLETSGIRTEAHRVNPVVFWDHAKDLTLPIGKTVDPLGVYTVSIGSEEASQTTFFSKSLLEAEQIFALIDEGIISANSIGFRPIKAVPLYVGHRRLGLHLQEVELLEISWVGVPCNQEAVRSALGRDKIAGKALAESLRRSLTPFAGRANAWANGVELVKNFAGRAVILKAGEFSETDHPRGQPGNAGQFGPGGGSQSSGSDDADGQDDDEEPDEPEEEDDGEDLHEKWADEAEAVDLINQTEPITPEAVEQWNSELEEVGSETRLYAQADGSTVADLIPEEMAIVTGLADLKPTTIAEANAKLQEVGDWQISYYSPDGTKPQLIPAGETDDGLNDNVDKIAKTLKSLADINTVNAALEENGADVRV